MPQSMKADLLDPKIVGPIFSEALKVRLALEQGTLIHGSKEHLDRTNAVIDSVIESIRAFLAEVLAEAEGKTNDFTS